jgi:hypothetical protein
MCGSAFRPPLSLDLIETVERQLSHEMSLGVRPCAGTASLIGSSAKPSMFLVGRDCSSR